MSSISGVGSATTSDTGDSGTLGDAAPISFPGIASGINYNAIIEKLTSLTLAQNKPLETELTSLNNANTELIKIKNLVAAVQTAITNLSDPSLFNQFSATSSNSAASTAAQISGQTPNAGTTTILSQSLATSTTITSDVSANQPAAATATLGSGVFQIPPTYGSNGQATLTINGVVIRASSLTTLDKPGDPTSIVAQLNAIPGVTASYNNNQLTISSTGPLSIGSASDTGNLASVLKLDTAPITSTVTSTQNGLATGTLLNSIAGISDGQFTINGQTITVSASGGETVGQLISSIDAVSGVTASLNGSGQLQIQTTVGSLTIAGDTSGLVSTLGIGGTPTESVTSSSGVGGFNPASPLQSYGITGNTFTINGVAISLNPQTDGISDVINRINASSAGVLATFDTSSGTIQLVSKATGPQSIVLGSPTDNSNFLNIVGLTSTGAHPYSPTNQVGQQAQVTFLNQSGNQQTVYSSSNTLSSVIPGINLTLNSSTSTPYAIQVSSDSSNLVSAIQAFTTAYNAAINEINIATAPPVVQGPAQGSLPVQDSAQSQQLTAGGPLYDNLSVQEIKDNLISLVTNIYGSGSGTYSSVTSGKYAAGSASYNSLASIGLLLDNSVGVVTSNSTSGDSSSSSSSDSSDGLSVQTYDGTTGKLQALDTTTFAAALQADPAAVQSLFVGAGSVSNQLASYLTYVTGSPTLVGGSNGTYASQAPTVSLLQSIEDSNSAQIQSVNQQITLVSQSASQQADMLRQEFTASETMIAELQAEQQQLAGYFGGSSSSSSS